MGMAFDDESRRVLQVSGDSGVSWRTVFDYVYKRVEGR
jgi:hypothetical protein